MASHYVPRSPVSHAPDIPSPIFPDRPIRPLPKRRIRSRLPAAVAESILYAPPPPEAPPLFYYPYKYSEPERTSVFRETNVATSEHHAPCMCSSQHERATAECELDSDHDELSSRTRALFQRPEYPELNGRHPASAALGQQSQVFDASRAQVKPPNSTSSSVDGYDSFENTKNKKKRKIPSPGSLGTPYSHLSADLANLDISSRRSSPDDTPSTLGQQIGTDGISNSPTMSVTSPAPTTGASNPAASNTSATTGPSASNGGRVSRTQWRNGNSKSPLGVSSDGSNAWGNGRGSRIKPKDWNANGVFKGGTVPYFDYPAESVKDGGTVAPATMSIFKHDEGFVSTGMPNASQGDVKIAAKDQENVSLLQRQAARKPTPAHIQFTFTAASNVAWPGGAGATVPAMSMANGHLPMPGSGPAAKTPLPPPTFVGREMATQGTQTATSFVGNRRSPQTLQMPHFIPGPTRQAPQPQAQASAQPQPQPQPSPQQAPANTGQQAPQPGKKSRTRRNGNQYALAARERRLQQRYKNYHHPPSGDDIWICEFCEYESIFGSPPEALVRQYEIKDLKERRRLEEKRRLLEKAKMKGRKGKKASKAASKTAAAAPAATQQPGHQPVDQSYAQAQGMSSDGYARGEFFDSEDGAASSLMPQIPAVTASDKPTFVPPMQITSDNKLASGGEAIRAH